MESFWEIAIGLTGLGGVATFVLFGLYKDWLTLPIFATLTKQQTFSLMRLFLALTFAFAVLALVAHVIGGDSIGDVSLKTDCGPAINDVEGPVVISGSFECPEKDGISQ